MHRTDARRGAPVSTIGKTIGATDDPEFIPLVVAPGNRSLMRDAGRVITIGAGIGMVFVLVLSTRLVIPTFVFACVSLVALGALLWAAGTLEARLIEIRNVLGGSTRHGPDYPDRDRIVPIRRP